MKDVARSGLEVLTWNFRSGAADVDVSGGRREEGGGRAGPGRAFSVCGLVEEGVALACGLLGELRSLGSSVIENRRQEARSWWWQRGNARERLCRQRGKQSSRFLGFGGHLASSP